MVRYILEASPHADPAGVGAALAPALGPRAEEMVVTAGDRIRKEGRAQGRVEGRVEGERALLLELLQVRFGSLSAEARAHLDAADEARLLAWSKSVLTAPTIEAVMSV